MPSDRHAKRCIGTRITMKHYFLPNPNASIPQKYAENLGYCSVCWLAIPRSNSVISVGSFEKKYPSRNDRADIMPSSDYE